ncbi:MAG: acetylxylan esterase [bacterium]|nr:acetylxylan esterase [bacterium]
MAFIDMPLEELRTYQPALNIPADFDTFWVSTLESARQHDLNPVFEPVDYGLKLVEIYDVTFSGYAGQRIRGWFVLPREREGTLPCLVEYIGYGGGRGYGFEHIFWANAGYAYFIMDTRGQGSAWRHGDTPDLAPDGDNAQYPGFMTRGILSPATYYYRRVFTDAVRAIEAARSHPAVDAARIAVTGGSQGGAITIAAAGLVPDLQAALPDVPFLCHFRRATTITDAAPYSEISSYLRVHRNKVENVFHTLAYFDGLHFAARSNVPALYSVGLMDTICPPSTVFAAYNHLNAPKEIRIYEFNNHEGGAYFQTLEKLNYLKRLWG